LTTITDAFQEFSEKNSDSSCNPVKIIYGSIGEINKRDMIIAKETNGEVKLELYLDFIF
jgi:hypothetical protein